MRSGAAPRIRALVLAAGRGSRLQPLTHFVPKPLLPVAGRPVLARTLESLARAGCEAVAINLWHLGAQIREAFGTSFDGMPITYSQEEKRLGTLGALYPLRDFLRPADLLLLVNGDTVCDWPFRRLLRRHRAAGSTATLLLARRPDPQPFGGGVAIDKKGQILSFTPGAPRGAQVADRQVFAGAHVLDRRLLDRIGEGPADIVPGLYEPLLAEGHRLQTLSTRRRWHDLGTPERYLEAAIEWGRGRWPRCLWRRNWVAPRASVATAAHLREVVVEPGARVAPGVRLERVLLLPGSRIRAGCALRDVVVGFGVNLPARARIERRLVTPRRKDQPVDRADSVVAELVYTPFDTPKLSMRDGDLR